MKINYILVKFLPVRFVSKITSMVQERCIDKENRILYQISAEGE